MAMNIANMSSPEETDQEAIISKGYAFLRIDGTTKASERQKIVNDFQEGKGASIFLLTSQVGGLGLTLTRADRVIVVDPAWNPSTDNQSVDRAYRIGQNKDVLVYRLMTSGTIEEKIYRLQVFKGGLFKSATEHKEQTRYFSQRDLQELFSLPKQGFDISLTQQQMHEEHHYQHSMDDSLKSHIKFLESQGIAGLSHHNLLFSKTKPLQLVQEDEKEIRSKYAFNPKDKQQWAIDAASALKDAKAAEIQKKIERISQTLANKSLVSKLSDQGKKLQKHMVELKFELDKICKSPKEVKEIIDVDDISGKFDRLRTVTPLRETRAEVPGEFCWLSEPRGCHVSESSYLEWNGAVSLPSVPLLQEKPCVYKSIRRRGKLRREREIPKPQRNPAFSMAKQENAKTNSSAVPPQKPPPPRSPPSDQDLDPVPSSLEKFDLYETQQRFYLIGSDRNKRYFRVLKIDRSEPSELNISEDPVVYTQQEVNNLLQRIKEGNRVTGGLLSVVKAYGIAGCIKFLESYYLILVTKRRQIGAICGHAIYGIDESQLITVPHSSVQTDVAHSKTEQRYKKLLSSVDLTKDFFYSYTYPIMLSLQQNVLAMGEPTMSYENMFVWNAYLTQAIRSSCNNTLWTIALVHGHFKQVRLSIFGREFSVSLISRRSRHFAGTRYLKRGVNDRGRVANDVETEQIVLDEAAGSCEGKMSSVVQMRGSIPLFWSQEASRFSPKPDIILQRYDPTYQATKLHFEDLARRYGNPIITVEKRPREMMLRREFANAVGYLNQILCEECHLEFIHWDFHKFAKSKSANVLAVLGAVASKALDLTGFYYSGKPAIVRKKKVPLSRTSTGSDASLALLRVDSGELARNASMNELLNPAINLDCESEFNQQPRKDNEAGTAPHYQSGVLRTNCIDCLDRTNVAQYAYGLAALGRQLHAMGLTDIPKVDPDSSIATALMGMYQSMGDALAQQYGGSAAHNTVFPERQGKCKATTQSREFIKSIKRYYSNAYTDGEKQDAINLFLGYFQPQEGKPALWELDSDYYLHISGIGDEPVPDRSSSFDAMPALATRTKLSPVPACKEDFSRMKLTSFNKLIERTCSSIKNVRLCSEPELKVGSGAGNSGMAPDAAEIQLKSPNWLFGHRKYEENNAASKAVTHENTGGNCQYETSSDGYYDLNLLSPMGDACEEAVFQRAFSLHDTVDVMVRFNEYAEYLSMASDSETNSWYGGTLLYDQDESSECYQHYAKLCQGPAMEPFEHDPEKERHYADALCIGLDGADDVLIEVEMEAALEEYHQIGADLGIVPTCKSFSEDPSRLTRWILGEEKLQGRA
ncbi:Phosphoinositide phosphatase sac1 [Asimina triloba]